MTLAGDAMTRDKSLFEMAISLDFNKSHISNIYNTVLVFCEYFNNNK